MRLLLLLWPPRHLELLLHVMYLLHVGRREPLGRRLQQIHAGRPSCCCCSSILRGHQYYETEISTSVRNEFQCKTNIFLLCGFYNDINNWRVNKKSLSRISSTSL